MILVITIPHTGTHFVRDHLCRDYRAVNTLPPADDQVFCAHISEGSEVDLARMATEHPTIVPLRHPLSVARSWKRRGKDLRDLPDHWRRLIQFIDPADPCYLPLDSPARDYWLIMHNARLGLNLTTDWPVLREADTEGLGWPELTHREIRDYSTAIMHERPDFFDRWYGPMPEIHKYPQKQGQKG